MKTTHNLDKITSLKELWTVTKGDREICIAVLDGPVDLKHTSLKDAKLRKIDQLNLSKKIRSHHGTAITSIIFGNPDGPITGISPNCQGLILPIYQESENGKLRSCTQEELARAIELALSYGAHIINCSGGERGLRENIHPSLHKAVKACEEKGCLIIAPTGNDGQELSYIPAVLPTVLAVGSMDSKGTASKFSNWGAVYKKNGILVPGEDILGATVTMNPSTVSYFSATSFTTPILSGISALLATVQKQHYGWFDLLMIRDILLKTALSAIPNNSITKEKALEGRLKLNHVMEILIS